MASLVPASLIESVSEGVVPVKFVTGQAGTGKTYNAKAEIAADPKFGMLTATTGIAAVNLGAVTLNSLLKYFDTASLSEAFFNGWLQKTILKLALNDYRYLVIDEISMLDGLQLDILYQAIKQVNEMLSAIGKPPLGIYLTGDFCQLPPVKAKWAFEAECWPFFEAATERLTKVWRQEDAKFLEAVNHIRAGRGMVGATILSQMGVEFAQSSDINFQGTTIMAKNDSVDQFNWLCLSRLNGIMIKVRSNRWMTQGRQMPSEWKHVPTELCLKEKALVMLLANDNTQDFRYVNGDCGHIIKHDTEKGTFTIRLVRNLDEVEIGTIARKETQKEPPDELMCKYPEVGEDDLRELEREPGMPYWDKDHGRDGAWVTGCLTFYPIKLAYASTVHKTQGLTLDRVQVDLKQNYMSAFGMCYVAISRCKTPQGLRIVGSPSLLGARVKTDPVVQKWL